jgi:hypothetical protein
VRTVIGTTPTVLARRGMALDRLTMLTLRRDGAQPIPGPSLPLWLGERTQYRAATSIRDTFDRPDGALGTGYTPWIPADTGGLVLQDGQVVPGLVNAEPHLAVYDAVLPREQWGEIVIRALTGAGTVGLGLRFVTQSGYFVAARPGTTRLRRLNVGASTTLLDLVTPWQVGEILRLTVDWDRLRIFRNGILIGDCVDPAPLLVTGQAALYASRPSASDAAALDDFAAGPLRQEYLGLLADVGDVSASLGFVEPTATPAAWIMSVINLAPVGPPGRFSIAWRHGQNDGPDTYDLHRAPVRVAIAVAGGSVPFALAEGRVDHPEAVTEGWVRLACAGRDAFLTPDIQAGVVAYLPGPDPISTEAPVPADPCGADADPVIVTGSIPEDIPIMPPPVATGPEAAAGTLVDTYAMSTYTAIYASTGHLAVPGNNPVTDSIANGTLQVRGLSNGPPILGPVTLVAEQLMVGVVTGGDPFGERRAYFMITRSAGMTGTHLRIGITITSTHDTNLPPQRHLDLFGTPTDPMLYETFQDIADDDAKVSLNPAISPWPPDDGTMDVYDLPVGLHRTILLYLSVSPTWTPPAPNSAHADMTVIFGSVSFVP